MRRVQVEIVFEELVKVPWMEKGKTAETMTNYFDMKTRYVKEYVDGVVGRIKRDLETEETKLARLNASNLLTNRWCTAPSVKPKPVKKQFLSHLSPSRGVRFSEHLPPPS